MGRGCVVFKLGGRKMLPELPPFTEPPFSTAGQFADAAAISRGAQVFEAQCQTCHGRNGAVRSTFPDLGRSPALQSQELLRNQSCCRNALRTRYGIVSRQLKPGDQVDLRAYLISLAQAPEAQGNSRRREKA